MIVSVFMKYVSEGKREFSDNPSWYSMVKEKVMINGNEHKYQIIVGIFSFTGLDVCYADYVGSNVGAAGARKSIIEHFNTTIAISMLTLPLPGHLSCKRGTMIFCYMMIFFYTDVVRRCVL